MPRLVPYPFSLSHDTMLPDMLQTLFGPLRQRNLDGIAGMDIDITEADGAYVVKAEIPGVAKEDVSVEIDGNMVSIRANKQQQKEVTEEGRVIRQERYWGQLERTVGLSSAIDEGSAKATYQDGVLSLTLHKKAGHDNKKLQIE